MGIAGTKLHSKAYENYNKTSQSRLTLPEIKSVDLEVNDNEFKNILVNAYKKINEEIKYSPKKGFIPKLFKPNLKECLIIHF